MPIVVRLLALLALLVAAPAVGQTARGQMIASATVIAPVEIGTRPPPAARSAGRDSAAVIVTLPDGVRCPGEASVAGRSLIRCLSAGDGVARAVVLVTS